ncbi:MAG TPA: hypothetical protein VIN39_10105 [Candidatus Dormibacteraeota bacterium]
MRRASRGQVGAEFAMVLAFLFALGVTAYQFVDLGLAAAKVNHAAQEAAYVAGSSLEAAAGSQTPCWAVGNGLTHPQGYADAAICQTVVENLGSMDPNLVSVTVSPDKLVERGKRAPIRVTVTYRQAITSPLLRALMGATFTSTSEASSWSN